MQSRDALGQKNTNQYRDGALFQQKLGLNEAELLLILKVTM